MPERKTINREMLKERMYAAYRDDDFVIFENKKITFPGIGSSRHGDSISVFEW